MHPSTASPHRGEALMIAIALTVSLALAGSPVAAANPGDSASAITPPLSGLSAEAQAVRQRIDAATARVVEIEDEIEALEADERALAERLTVTSERIVAQREAVALAEARLAEAETRYRAQLIRIYKRGAFDPLTVLLHADNLPDLLSSADALSRIAEGDNRVVADLNIAAADMRYREAQLEELLAQDRALRVEQDTRHQRLLVLLEEQQASIAQLTAQEREILEEVRALTAQARVQWRESSVPTGTVVERATATVDTHPGVEYLVSAYMPREYRSTGQTYPAVCSWYGPGFHGKTTASGQVFNQEDLTCASRTLPFGTVLALTRGSRRVIVYVNDRGPFIAGRDLDLSKAAAAALGFSGVETVNVEVVTAVR